MYQPFNGLQVLPTGTAETDLDLSVFNAIPPEKCKKGGAPLRVNCGDDGYPTVKATPVRKDEVYKYYPGLS